MTRILIVNPFASGVDEHRLAAVRAALPSGTQTMLTTTAGEGTEIARSAGDVEAIYVFGGDGTFNEVLNGVETDVPLGFIPGGGTSVLPRALGLPRNPGKAAQRIAEGRTRQIGLGGKLPCNTAGGLISEGHLQGMGHVAEAVRQIRGTSYNQVPDVTLSMCTGYGGAPHEPPPTVAYSAAILRKP